jgi:hypothetical protein
MITSLTDIKYLIELKELTAEGCGLEDLGLIQGFELISLDCRRNDPVSLPEDLKRPETLLFLQ